MALRPLTIAVDVNETVFTRGADGAALDVLGAPAGVPAVTLTNGHAEMTAHLLERAGLRDLVVGCHDVGEIRCWKPAALPYRHCAQRNDVTPERMALVAVHSWDVHGARRAGLVTGYASRHEGGALEHFAPADVSAPDLVGVVEGLLGLPER